MRKNILILLFTVIFTEFCIGKTTRLGVVNPTPSNLEKIFYLVDNDYIDVDSLEIVGIYHESQAKLIESTNNFIGKNGYTNISIWIIKDSIALDSLFGINRCTNEFKELFYKTDGLIFLGGADILPRLYGEKTFLTTGLIPNERNWEISFLYHLTGGSQNAEFVPLLEQKPNYLILGICLGMQQINVAAGGSLYQDIPFQIYKKQNYESVLDQNAEKQHKNYQDRIGHSIGSGSILHFHHIKITPSSMLDFGQTQNPFVTSIHHQSVKKPGKNFQIIATSMDDKVVEAIANSVYRNVYGIQFHPEYPVLYQQQEFLNARNETISLDENAKVFLKRFWKDFSDRLANCN